MRPLWLALLFCRYELISGIAHIPWHYMKDYLGEFRSAADVYFKMKRQERMGYETSSGHQGASVLLLWLIFACSLSSQTGLFHQSSSFYWLCHCSLFHSLPSSFTSISPSLLPSFTLLPAPKASNSMVKYPGQCVALQRDSGSRYAGNGPGSKWRVIVVCCGCTSYRPQ